MQGESWGTEKVFFAEKWRSKDVWYLDQGT